MTTDDLNMAITVYIGKGFTKAPMPLRERLAREMGEKIASQTIEPIHALIDEMGAIPIDWSKMDLNDATDFVVGTLEKRHPELSSEALDALDWLYSWTNR